MGTNNWSLLGELQKLTGASSEAEALFELGIIPDIGISYKLRTDSNWQRGGAETYIYRFWVSVKQNIETGYIIKACVSPNVFLGIEGVIKEWLSRRELLSQNGVKVPKLFFAGQGVIIEEFIPWELRQYIKSNPDSLKILLPSIINYVETISQLGFAPIDCFTDLRTRGNDVVVIDFGEDMGPPRMVQDPSVMLYDDLLKVLHNWGITIDEKQFYFLRQSIHNARKIL